jgi:RNA polymerase sigma factor (sigma-70 family)
VQQSEKELLRVAPRGDTTAFGEVIKRYQYLVYSVALQIARDPMAAQDIAQETFISAFKGLRQLRSKESFASWLRAITRNSALSWQKKQKRVLPLEEARLLQSVPGTSVMEIKAERDAASVFQAAVRQIVSSLSATLRIPILLCYVDGIPTAEAARFLGIKEGTLRKRLHDGKRKLQRRIVRMAERSLQEHQLPRDFAKRCICGCKRSGNKMSQEQISERR